MKRQRCAGVGYVPMMVLGLILPCTRTVPAGDAVVVQDCHCSTPQQTLSAAGLEKSRGQVPPVQGNFPRIHDPVMTKEGETYYVFSTGRGIEVHTSKDRMTWQRQGPAFPQPWKWTSETIPGSRDFSWAPDISYFNGRWHLYYSVSTFGKNHSAIGLATNVTLDSKRPDFQWKDEGLVVESKLLL